MIDLVAKKIKIISFAICSLLAYQSLLFAIQLNPTDVTLGIEYDEPSTSVDKSSNTWPLTDLKETTIYYSLGQSTVSAKNVPATKLTGGGHIDTTINVPIAPGQDLTVSAYATATSTNNLVSDKSNVDQMIIDRLPPGAPKYLTISEGKLFYTFREPILNADGTPLDDLASVNVYYNDNYSAAIRLLGTYPATNPKGGGSQSVSFPLTTFVPGSTIRIYPRFYDTSGNYSAFPQAIAIKLPN